MSFSQRPWWCPRNGVGRTLGNATLHPRCVAARWRLDGSAAAERDLSTGGWQPNVASRQLGGSRTWPLDGWGSGGAELAVEAVQLVLHERQQRRGGAEQGGLGLPHLVVVGPGGRARPRGHEVRTPAREDGPPHVALDALAQPQDSRGCRSRQQRAAVGTHRARD